MCGRYWIDEQELCVLSKRTGTSLDALDAKLAGEIFPGDRVPVLCKDGLCGMEWGFRMDDGKRVINARSETAKIKPLFSRAMVQARCLLPMSAYFEWEHVSSCRRKYRIAPESAGLHYLAGLYRMEEAGPTCTVLTMAAQPQIEFIHARMPLILSDANASLWLRDAKMPPSARMGYACEDGQISMFEL